MPSFLWIRCSTPSFFAAARPAAWASAFSANPVGKGAAELMNPDVSAYYNSAFDDAKLAALWWWPDQSAEFIAKRGEYADKYKAS